MPSNLELPLPRSTPEAQGISSSAISGFLEAIQQKHLEFHSLMLLRHGQVIAEGWWPPYASDKVHLLYSLSKSFTSTAVGLAIAEGRLSEDDTVISFFPDDLPETPSQHLAAMRVRHLLSMGTGHIEDTTQRMMQGGDNWARNFLSIPPEQAPGSIFNYNSGATYMLAAILHKLTGVPLLEYLRPRLLEPLGITQAHWQEDPKGIHIGFSGLHIVTESIAKFGQLYLQKGIWQGQHLLSETWVETATREHIPNASPLEDKTADWEQGYGYQFWRCQHNAYRADGAFGQYCVVMPEQDAVLAITSAVQDMQAVLDLVWTHLLPAMREAPLPDSPTAWHELSSQLASLNITPVKGETTSPFANLVSGKTYRFEASTLNNRAESSIPNREEDIQAITLNFDREHCLLVIKDAKKEHQIHCAYSAWLSGTTTFYSESASNVEVSGALIDETTFAMKIIFIETPHCLSISFRFDGENLRVNRKWNVSFGPLEPLQLIGQAKP